MSTLLLLLFPAALHAEVNVPDGNNADPIMITAQAANRWQMDSMKCGSSAATAGLRRATRAFCQEAVFWIEHADGRVATSERRS